MEKILTRNGVCKKLENSPYNFTYFHNGEEVTLNFSSKLHLENFTMNRQKNWAMIYNSIYKRFKFKTDCVLLADCNLYKKIENRGVFIKIGNRTYCDFKDIVLTN